MMLAAVEAWRCSHTCAWLEWEGLANETFLCCAKTCECVDVHGPGSPAALLLSNDPWLCFQTPLPDRSREIGSPPWPVSWGDWWALW